MAKKETKATIPERLKEMRSKGYEVSLPYTERKIRLKAVDAPTLLRAGNIPDMLTPLVTKTIYEDLKDREIRDFLTVNRGDVKEALDLADAVDFIVKHTIADGTKVEDLTPAEKRWVFRLVMEPAEYLVTFREDEDVDVGPVATGDEVQQTAQ